VTGVREKLPRQLRIGRVQHTQLSTIAECILLEYRRIHQQQRALTETWIHSATIESAERRCCVLPIIPRSCDRTREFHSPRIAIFSLNA